MDSKQLFQKIQRRPIKFVPGKKVVSIASGEWTSPYEGKGYEPLGYRDFQIGDDPRRINLSASARRDTPTIVERVALRDFKVMVVIDNSPSMRVREKFTIQLGVAALLLYSAWQSETTFGLAVRHDECIKSFGLGIGSRHFYYLYRKLWSIFLQGEKLQLKSMRKIPLISCLPPNAMLFYCSDFLKSKGDVVEISEFKRAVERYDFIPVIIQDEFESSFPQIEHGTFISFMNPETGDREEAWMSPENAREIRNIHETRFQDLIYALGVPRIALLHLDSPNVQQMGENIDKFFRKRKGRSG